MEKLPLPSSSSTISHTSSSSVSDNSPSTESRLIESTNWYDDGSIETCIHQSSSLQAPSTDLRVISDEEILHEVDMNGAGDEFFLFSPQNTTDDEPSSSLSDDKHDQDFEQLENLAQTSTNIFAMENNNLNLMDDFVINDEMQSPSSLDPFGFNHNNNNSSLMITNLDDILIDDDDDDNQNRSKNSPDYLSNNNYRRPIQEDILYEVEHENSYSDHSQNTSSIIATDDKASIKKDPNLDFLISTREINDNHVPSSTSTESSSPQEKELKATEINSSSNQNINDNTTLPIYISPSINTTTTTDKSSSLRIDTFSNPFASQWDSYNRRYPDLISPTSYTPKIRHRNFSVGSYYDNKTTTVAIHPNHTFFILGSAPVSPLSRTSATSHDPHYYVQHHSPIGYEDVPYNALRRVNPFLETNEYLSPHNYKRSTSLTRDDPYRTTMTSYSQQQTATIPSHEPILTSSSSPRSKNTQSVTFSQKDKPKDVSKSTSSSTSPSSPSSARIFEQVPSLIRPKTSRGRPRTPPPPPPPRTTSLEKDHRQNIYQEIDTTSTEDDQISAPNADLQFIRGTIERVFDFHDESASELSTNNDELSVDDKNDQESVSLSISSKTPSKKDNQYPAVEAVQHFYHNKTPSDSENKPTKNPDENMTSIRSSTSNNLYARSHPVNRKKKDQSDSKSSDIEQATSEEVDDTLNDIEEDEYQDEKLKRQATANNSSHTTKPILVTTQSPSGSQSTIQSYESARSHIPPLDIVTQMIIERNDSVDDGQIGEITGDMVIFYDDIEIVEHSSNISSTESDSTSSYSRSTQNSRHIETKIEPPPPPIPARTLKPTHLLNHHQQQQQASLSSSPLPQQRRNETIQSTGAKVNRTYELEKSNVRKKFDVNSVNYMLNRTDYCIGPTASHRLPSARHFVGKLNSDDTSSRTSSITSPKIIVKPSPSSSTMVKSHTLPLQPITNNGHSQNNILHSPTKNPFSTLPTRSASTVGTNGTHRSPIADTNALVKQIQNSLSRKSLHDSQLTAPLSISTKDLRTFVSSTYSPSDENMIDDNGIIHVPQQKSSNFDEQAFKRQARLSKSFHNVSEYNSIDQYPKNDNNLPTKSQPSKSVENNLNRVSQNPINHTQMPVNFPPLIASTSFGVLPQSEDHARLLSMKWYTGQVSENSEICYNGSHLDQNDLLYNYINRYSNREIQSLLARLQASRDIRIHAALDDVRFRVIKFDASKSPDDVHVFIRYLESRLRDINNTNNGSSSNRMGEQKRLVNGGTTNGYYTQHPQSDTISIKSRTSSVATGLGKDTPTQSRQLGRQHLRSSGNLAGGESNGYSHHQQQPPPPPRRSSQSSVNQENPAIFDDMLNTVLGLPKKGVGTLPSSNPSTLSSRDKSTPLNQTLMSINTSTNNQNGPDVGKRLFESGTLKDPRLIYDGSRTNEKEEQPLETSV
ncbi:hypothetical protein I4U23_029099 [Adineta vaga]|nr:hypothetical protein I4U23_029099 [Adineta vaga]